MARAVEAPGGMRSSQELCRSLLFAICLPITKMVLSFLGFLGRTAQRALANRFLIPKNPHCETRHHHRFDIYRRKLLGSSSRTQARKATEQAAILETQDDLAGHCEHTNVPHGRASSSLLGPATLVCAGRTPLSIVPCLVSLVTATVTSGPEQSAARRFHTITVSYRRVSASAVGQAAPYALL